MKDTPLNSLNTKQRRILQLGVVVILGLFLALYFYFLNKNNVQPPEVKNTAAYIQDSILYVFEDTISIAEYPNRVSMHYPYLLVIKPTEKVTHVYNLPEKKKEKDIPEGILDYYQDSVLKNDGKSTFLNDRDLGILCEKGFIKNENEILCLTKVNPNTVENKLVNIDVATKKAKDIYVSKNIITDFSLINGKVYMGEIDLYTKQNYLIIDQERIEVENVVSLIYEMNGNPYFASFKSELNSNTESYYLISGNTFSKQEGDRIYFLGL